MNKEDIKKLDTLFSAFSVVSEGSYVYLCDIKNNFSRWSKSAIDYFGLPDEYMYDAGKIWEEHIHPDDRKTYNESIDKIFSGRASSHDMQYRARTLNGNYVKCTCKGVVVTDGDGTPIYFGGTIKNNTILSYTDAITGLRSLYGFFDDIDMYLSRKMQFSILMVGMSRFSAINDVYGFRFGNNTLDTFAKLLSEKFGKFGTLYKMDGTKFALITTTAVPEELAAVYKEVKHRVTHSFTVNDEKVILSLNGGLITVDDFDLSKDTITSCLKYTYYQSKNSSLGDLEIFRNSISDDNRQFIEMMNVIRTSVTDGCKGFFLCYQPIMCAANEKLMGMEALIRWKNDTYGAVSPNQFIPILEQDPVFPELGRWILRQAIIDSKKYVEKYPDFLIHVNISYAQLERRDFINEITDILEELDFPPKNLCLELTERCRLLDIGLLKSLFKALRVYGIKIALDDFGTGFSSIGIIRELDFDTIKVDREFVKNIDHSASDQKTVHFISNLAETFQAKVCVEGVETNNIKNVLGNYDIESFQGFYYSRPIVMSEFAKKYFPGGKE